MSLSKIIFRDLNLSDEYENNFVAKVHTILGWKNSDNFTPDDLIDFKQWKSSLNFLESIVNNSKIILAIEGNNIIGVQWAQIQNTHDLNSHMIWVEKKYRNKGVAQKLRKKTYEWGILNGAQYFTSSTKENNIVMQNHNLKLGFKFEYKEVRGDDTYYVYKKKLKKSGSPVGGGVRS